MSNCSAIVTIAYCYSLCRISREFDPSPIHSGVFLKDSGTPIPFGKCKSLQPFFEPPSRRDNPCYRLVWRLRDLNHGGGLGFTVERFFPALRRLLPTSSSTESHSALYIGTFRVITSDWRGYKDSVGTQKTLLDMIISRSVILSKFDYPAFVTHEFLSLLGNFLKGQKGGHITDVVQEVSCDIPIRAEHKKTFFRQGVACYRAGAGIIFVAFLFGTQYSV